MQPLAYYNENEPYAAAWLRNLSAAGEIAPGVVDERSIADVQPADLAGFTQCHFFAGIGGWPLALRLAGWADDRRVWTGSCPCQPFSSAGKRKGNADDRHLWPQMFRLIRKCRPDTVFGEQVQSAIGHGWLDGVSADLEREGYAVGSVVLGAHSVGAPHIRQRLWWMADAAIAGRSIGHAELSSDQIEIEPHGPAMAGGLADSSAPRRGRPRCASAASERPADESGRLRTVDGLGNSIEQALERHAGHGDGRNESGRVDADAARPTAASSWSDFTIIYCRDGKCRRVPRAQSEVLGVADGLSVGMGSPCPDRFPLAEKTPHRVGSLKGYGNAIVPEEGAVFIASRMDAEVLA